MASELEAAAARLRKQADGYDYEYRCTRMGTDQATISDAALAMGLFREDDATAYSQNFCEDIGFEFGSDPVELATLTVAGVTLALRRDYMIHMGPYPLPHITTRGQLRLLLKALGGNDDAQG